MWLTIKYLHITLALVSVSGFLLRGILMLLQSRLLQQHWIKRLPHLVDTLLLASGVLLAWHLHQYPFVNSYWLTAKMLALLAYIGFGMLALNYGKTRVIRGPAFVVALCCAAYILSTASLRNGLVLATR
jgi:uncharacterized membrane protein SirB2